MAEPARTAELLLVFYGASMEAMICVKSRVLPIPAPDVPFHTAGNEPLAHRDMAPIVGAAQQIVPVWFIRGHRAVLGVTSGTSPAQAGCARSPPSRHRRSRTAVRRTSAAARRNLRSAG